MTNSVHQDALLSNFSVLAYQDRTYLEQPANLPAGWRLVAFEAIQPPIKAFAGMAFQQTSGAVVIAFRGTDGLSDAAADKALALGQWHAQFQAGMDFYAALKNDSAVFPNPQAAQQCLIAGHSLGGSIAQLVAQAYGLDGSCIDPGGAALVAQTAPFKAATKAAKLPLGGLGIDQFFNNYLVTGSLVSNGTGAHLGRLSYLPSLNFSGSETLKAVLLGVFSPAAALAYAAWTDQIKNKHRAEQIRQAMALLAQASESAGFDSSPFFLCPKLLGWDTNENAGEEKPRYSQTEFELQNDAGQAQARVKFSGAESARRCDIFALDGALAASTISSPLGYLRSS